MARLPWIPALALAGACFTPNRALESARPGLPPGRFRTLAVIAGDDGRHDLNIMAGVREQLREGGFEIATHRGRWETEIQAIEELCRIQAADGMVTVYFDRLTLRACPETEVVYQIRGGGELGVPQMARRMIEFLRTGRPAS
jgi:hypothetical protein